jgi:DNA mismatch repair protein MutL
VHIRENRTTISVDLWAGPADLHRPARDGIHLFVNRRSVRDPLLTRAILDGYRQILPANRYPVVVLYLDLPPGDVDVNVHPAKFEVRFHKPHEVRAVVLSAVAQALASRGAIPHLATGATPVEHSGPLPLDPRVPDQPAFGTPDWPSVREGVSSVAAATQRPEAGAVSALAQYRNCYIVAHDAEGLLVVDQHVAHERLLYESLLRLADSGPLPRQVLLFPATIEVGPAAVEVVDENREALAQIGFGIEPFGDGAVIVREVPAVLGREAAPETVGDILEGLKVGDGPDAAALFHRMLATVACHSAVRKGMPLSLDKMDYILKGLTSCAAPSHCPHGRVISLRVDLASLDRGFGRTS